MKCHPSASFLLASAFFSLLAIDNAAGQTCYVYDTNFRADNMNDGFSNIKTSASACQSSCQSTPGCLYWSWFGPTFTGDQSAVNTCWLKNSAPEIYPTTGVVSGPRDCQGGGSCCETLEIDSGGMGGFYQRPLLGTYTKYVEESSGRFTYAQMEGNNYLYYLEASGMWMIGPNLYQTDGGLRNTGSSQCPEGRAVMSWNFNNFCHISQYFFRRFNWRLGLLG